MTSGAATRVVEVLAREAAGGRVLVRGWLRWLKACSAAMRPRSR